MKNKIKSILCLLTVSFLLTTVLAGCGYTTRSMLAGKFSTIYITPFLNKVDVTQESYSENKYRIYRPMLETDITKKVINRYLFDGNLKPVKGRPLTCSISIARPCGVTCRRRPRWA